MIFFWPPSGTPQPATSAITLPSPVPSALDPSTGTPPGSATNYPPGPVTGTP